MPPVPAGTLLTEIRTALTDAGIDNPRLEARLIVGASAGLTTEQLIARPEAPVDAVSAAFARALAER
ncbi:MAG: peptide chain release factor N(5)-glutamine methyltransferase, partial [Alphaproteobacteria bacterium]|nr:peptide chain release factor N(5)-glutamine methyltransferase [Alphaproteobacteria bacterium]